MELDIIYLVISALLAARYLYPCRVILSIVDDLYCAL